MAICLHPRSRWKLVTMVVCCCGLLWVLMLSIGMACCAVPRQPDLALGEAGAAPFTVQGRPYPPPHEPQPLRYRFQHQNPDNVLGKRLLQDVDNDYDYEDGYTNSLAPHQGEQADVYHIDTASSAKTQHIGDNSDRTKHTHQDSNSYSDNLSLNPTRRYTPTKVEHLSGNTNHDRTSNKVSLQSNNVISEGTKKLPQAIIIGVKKGGTRALLEFLRIHPDVKAPGPETHFFDRHYDKGLEWYREQMPATLAGQMTVEKTPSYLITKEVPRRVYSMSRDIKLVVVLRDPVTRAISDYTQAASKRPGMKPFEQMAFLSNYTGLVNTSWGAIRIGVYAKHIDRWLKYFPLRQMHFVSGEKLITEPAKEMIKVQDFLGLKRVINENHFVFNETKGFPCLKKTATSSKPHCLGKSKGRHHPTVSNLVLERLRDFFRPFNRRLYQMVGQNFHWP